MFDSDVFENICYASAGAFFAFSQYTLPKTFGGEQIGRDGGSR